MKILTCCALAAALAAGCSSSTKDSGSNRVLPNALVDTSDVRSGDEFKLPGNRVYVELNLMYRNQKLALVNAGSAKPAEVYSKFATPGLALKVADDTTMAKLHRALTLLRFDDLTESSEPAQTLWSLSVEVDGVRRTVYNARGRNSDRHAQLQDLMGIFMEGFNRTLALQSVDPSKGGKTLFTNEEQRLKDQNPKKQSGVK
jgi:hypothetical protein